MRFLPSSCTLSSPPSDCFGFTRPENFFRVWAEKYLYSDIFGLFQIETIQMRAKSEQCKIRAETTSCIRANQKWEILHFYNLNYHIRAENYQKYTRPETFKNNPMGGGGGGVVGPQRGKNADFYYEI